MRVLNRHKAAVAGIEPGCAGEVDETNSGIKVFLEAGLLVDADTLEPTPEREPTLDELRDRASELEVKNKQIAAIAETNASELKKAHDASAQLAARVAELEAQLAAKAESTPTAEPTSSPEAPAKKGKG